MARSGQGTKAGLEWLGGDGGPPRFSADSVKIIRSRSDKMGLYDPSGPMFLSRSLYSELPWWTKRMRQGLIGLTGFGSFLMFRGLARGRVQGIGVSRLQALVEEARRDGRGLITVSNHVATIDDPVVWGSLSWWWCVSNPDNLRWTWASEEICFAHKWHARYFGLGQNIPILRGAGLEQPGVAEMQEKLNAGLWCHVFAEAKCSQEGQLRPLRWGVGRLIAEAPKCPIVVPIVHTGMEDFIPDPHHPDRREELLRFLPRPCRAVMHIGEPIDVSKHWEQRQSGSDRQTVYADATETIEKELRRMHQSMYPHRYEAV